MLWELPLQAANKQPTVSSLFSFYITYIHIDMIKHKRSWLPVWSRHVKRTPPCYFLLPDFIRHLRMIISMGSSCKLERKKNKKKNLIPLLCVCVCVVCCNHWGARGILVDSFPSFLHIIFYYYIGTMYWTCSLFSLCLCFFVTDRLWLQLAAVRWYVLVIFPHVFFLSFSLYMTCFDFPSRSCPCVFIRSLILYTLSVSLSSTQQSKFFFLWFFIKYGSTILYLSPPCFIKVIFFSSLEQTKGYKKKTKTKFFLYTHNIM